MLHDSYFFSGGFVAEDVTNNIIRIISTMCVLLLFASQHMHDHFTFFYGEFRICFEIDGSIAVFDYNILIVFGKGLPESLMSVLTP